MESVRARSLSPTAASARLKQAPAPHQTLTADDVSGGAVVVEQAPQKPQSPSDRVEPPRSHDHEPADDEGSREHEDAWATYTDQVTRSTLLASHRD